MKGVTDDRQTRSVKIVEVLFRIEVPRWSPRLQKFAEETDLSPTRNDKRPRISVN
jgi:hypothetical protein